MNKVILIGNVGSDPVVKMMPDNVTAVAQVRLATTKRGYTKQDGTQVPDKTTWHTCIFWRKLAETVGQYVHKGDRICVEGEYESREYADKQNPQVKHTVYEVTVNGMEMLTPKNQQAAPAPQAPPAPGYGQQYQQAPQYQPAPQYAPPPAPAPQQYAPPQQGTIPFPQQPAGAAPQGAPQQGYAPQDGNSDLPF